jgi:hypothetical protein
MAAPNIPTLAELESIPYLDQKGEIPREPFEDKVGIYSIFNQEQTLEYVGFSRNIYASLKEHLVRRPQLCYWIKVVTIERPNRTQLEEIRNAWFAENGTVPRGNGVDEQHWTQAIDAKLEMTETERNAIEAADEGTKIKLLKDLARRIETGVQAKLQARGVTMPLRFDPKIKEKGLLTLK